MEINFKFFQSFVLGSKSVKSFIKPGMPVLHLCESYCTSLKGRLSATWSMKVIPHRLGHLGVCVFTCMLTA